MRHNVKRHITFPNLIAGACLLTTAALVLSQIGWPHSALACFLAACSFGGGMIVGKELL